MAQQEDWNQFPAVGNASPLPNGGVYVPPTMTPEQVQQAQQAATDDARADRTEARGERQEDRQAAASTWSPISPEEAAAAGLPAGGTYQRNGLGEIKTIASPPEGGQGGNRAAKLRTLLEQLDRVQELYGTEIKGGVTPNVIAGNMPGFLRPENEQFNAAAAALAEQGLSAFRVPGVGSQSDAELRQFVTANRPNSSDTDLAIEEKLRSLRTRAEAEIASLEPPVTPSAASPAASPPATPPATPSAAPEPGVTGAAGTFMTPRDKELQDKLSAAYNAGASLAELQAITREYGVRTGLPATQAELDKARKEGRQINVLPSGFREEAPSVMGITPESGGGAFMIGAANALTSGGLDELVGALGGDAAMAEAGKQAIRDKFPASSFAGEVAGTIMQAVPVNRALGAVGATGRLAQVGSEVAQGAAYGAGESNDNRALGAAAGVGGPLAARGIAERFVEPAAQAIIQRISRETGTPVEVVEQVAREALEAAEPPTGNVVEDKVSDELVSLARQATSSGPRSRSAQRKLAQAAAIDPEAAAAAERLGVRIPPDVLSENAQLRNLTGLARSQAGSDAEATWQRTAGEAASRVESLLEEVGATRDLAQLSTNVSNRITATMENLKSQADALRSQVDEVVDPQARMNAESTRAVLSQQIGDLGGRENLNALETRLLKLIDDENPPTYAFFNRIRDDIGQALERGKGPFADIDQRTLGRYYAALKQDRLDFVRQVGGDELAEKLASSNALYSQMYHARAELTDLFGKDLEGSIVRNMRAAVTSGSKGDAERLNQMLARVPQDMQGDVIMSALMAESMSKSGTRDGFSFTNFAKLYRGIRDNGPIYRQVARAVGPQGEQVLTDLYAIGRRMADADSRLIRTGRANQAQLGQINAENLASAIIRRGGERVATAAAVGGGAAAGGPLGGIVAGGTMSELLSRLGKGGASRLDQIHSLLSSSQFKETIEKVAAGDTSPSVLNRLANSNAFVRFSRAVGMDTPEARRGWLESILTRSGSVGATGAVPANEQPSVVELTP